MSELSKKYQDIISELDNRIENKDDLIFVKEKLSEISIIFIDLIERMSGVVEEKISDIESKLENIEESINSIKEDIYEEEAETEVVCPYCNNEFYAEVSDEIESEVECPECHNIIELDMNSDDIENDLFGIHGCQNQCGGCSGCNRQKNNEKEK